MSVQDEPAGVAPAAGESAAARGAAQSSAGVPSGPRRGSRVAAGLALLALILALAAGAGTAWLWARLGALQGVVSAEAGAASRALDAARARLDGIESELVAAEASLAAAADERRALGGRVEPLPGRIAELGRRVDAVAGGSRAVEQRWRRAEAEYYLELANARLTLADDWSAARAALGLADARLAELGDPRVADVRAAIAAERLALESVELPDYAGLAAQLGGLAARVPELPLRDDAVGSRTAAPAAGGDVEPGVGRLLDGVENALSSLVRVERRDEPVAAVLSAAEQRLVRRQLELNLELARLALARREAQAFAAALESARALLDREFDPAAPAVARALDLLAQLAAVDVAPPKPDIGDSLARLRALPGGAE